MDVSMSVAGSAYIVADLERMVQAKNYLAWQARVVLPEVGQRVLEVGCGIGNFTGRLLDRETVIAVDVEQECIDRLAERYGNRPNLRAFAFDIDAGRFADLARFAPDSCVCLNVLEHVRDDDAALRGMASALPSGGKIVLIVPAFPSLYGPIDRNLGHFRRYTRASLTRLATAVGLRVNKLKYMNFAGFFGWWMNSHIFRRQEQSESQIRFFDRNVVPVAWRVEKLIPPPFGQSVVAVLEKS
jgi:2-polyprenyl-3-methyl-5-hydroxy-6-metoxy-1,4-benzoquinol methylase